MLAPFSDLLAASDPNYHKYEDLLSPGWIPGRKIVCSITEVLGEVIN